ncbi:NADAR family protein [Nonomuraea sp. GTA35]|uniref:NADAR family protein n=1 Tax=Nonomuraea sp. GTA35 TaxID=1676746 RepID=UPI0035BF64A3
MLNRTFREVDGERIEGLSRPVFICNGGHYFLTELVVYADGAIDVWGLTDLEGLRRHLETGWVATSIPRGAQASADHLASWRMARTTMHMTAEGLLGEVADAIDELNGRPDSSERCWMAIERYMETRSEDDLRALREAYLAVPELERQYVLGDMGSKDLPLVDLMAEPREAVPQGPGDPSAVTEEDREEAIAYFEEVLSHRSEPRPPGRADDPEPVEAGAITLYEVVRAQGRPEDPGVAALRNEYPAEIEVGGVRYPTVVHAYWALSTADPAARERIAAAARPYDAERLARETARVEKWANVRAAVMARLLRAKFAQHPRLAEILLGTGTARLHYSGAAPDYWTTAGSRGRNWMGRLLELVRSELQADQATEGRSATG